MPLKPKDIRNYKNDLELLCKYASKCKFIIETGGGGLSTKYLSKIACDFGIKFVSIELFKKRSDKKIRGVEYKEGWSISYKDMIKKGDKDFFETRKFKNQATKKSLNFLDMRIAHRDEKIMYKYGEVDLIRKTLDETDIPLDFFFCDTGEYCGLAEWNIVKNRIKKGGYFAIHDIYYPKSIKGFKVREKIEKSKNWKRIEITKNKQGLLIAQKIK